MIRVYIAGPYTHGDVAQNVRHAILIADDLWQRGYIPYVPHLMHFWHVLCPHTHAEWVALDMHWLACCHVILRFPGPSEGADAEVARAEALGIPICYSLEELLRHATDPGWCDAVLSR